MRARFVQDCALTVGVLALATVARLALDPWLGDRAPYLLYLVAIIGLASLRGLGPALVCTLAGVVLGLALFVSPRGVVSIDDFAIALNVAMFTGIAVVLSFFGNTLRLQRQRLRALATQAVERQRELEQTLSQRAGMEQRLRLEHEQFRTTLASIGDAVITTDTGGRITFMNAKAESMTGWRCDDVVGQPLATVFRIVHEHTREPAESPVELALRHNHGVELTQATLLLARDGRELAIDDSAAPIRDAEGELSGVVLVFRDVSDKRRAEIDRARLAAIVDHSHDAIYAKSLDGVIQSWNEGAHRLYGYTADEIVGRSVSVLMPEGRQRELDDIMQCVSRGEATSHFETLRRRKDGSHVQISLQVSPLRSADGELIGASTIARDITHAKRAERKLRQSEERLRIALEAGRMGSWEWNVLSGEVFWSPMLEAIHGLERGSFPGTLDAFMERVHPDDRPRVEEELRRTLDSGTEHHIEYRLRTPQGDTRWAEARGQLFRDESGRPVRMAGVCMDVTERKRDEEELRFVAVANAELASLVDPETTLAKIAQLAVPEFADWCVVDLVRIDGTLQRVAVAHADPGRAEIARRIARRYPEPPDSALGAPAVLRTGEAQLISDISDELLRRHTRDEAHFESVRALGLRSYVGVPLKLRDRTFGVLSFVSAESGRRYDASDLRLARDVAERAAISIENARLYRELRDSDRRKDEFLATLAHELRNPLAPMRSALEILRRTGDQPAARDRARGVLERQLHQMVRLVDDLLDVSRITQGKVELQREIVDLATIVESTLETARPQIEWSRQKLTVDLPSQPLRLDADPTRLSQVLLNLLSNASKYTPRGGHIRLSAERHDDQVWIRVQDDGIGIAPEALPHIFEIFMQASPPIDGAQGGLGIGLSLVRTLVALHGGDVIAKSAGPGQGTEFVVRLPLVETASEEARPSSAQPEATPAHAIRILVVDDNVDGAESLRLLLEMQGHEVETAGDGRRALELADKLDPDLVLLDIGLPEISGYEVARRLRAAKGDRVVLVALTGYGQAEDRRRASEAGFDHHAVKPIDPDTLLRLVASVSQRSGASV